jgi:NAD(P)-dependent dehydrogenase (short-subunit alcohol dehydrogenase family)
MASLNNPVALTLQGKVAIVTGASRGIGAGIALELARRGARVSRAYYEHLTQRCSHVATGHACLYVSRKQRARREGCIGH